MLFLLFELGKDRYAIDIREVAEVLPLVQVTQVPQSPAGLAGVFNYRGALVPVVDLSMLALGHAALPRLSTRLILMNYPDGRGHTHLLGLIAEHATNTMRRESEAFVASGVTTGPTSYLGPMTIDARGIVQWIDVTKLLPVSIRDVLFGEPVGHA